MMILHDLRIALRSLRHWRTAWLACVASLGVGIGATATMFGMLHVALGSFSGASQPPVRRVAWRTTGTSPLVVPFTGEEYRMIASAQNRPGNSAAYRPFVVAIGANGRTLEVRGAATEAGFATVLGLRPHRGRWFIAAEVASDDPVVVLGRATHERLFGSDALRPGARVLIGERLHDVIGILGSEYFVPTGVDFHIPLSSGLVDEVADLPHIGLLLRAKPGDPVEEARIALELLLRGDTAAVPETADARRVIASRVGPARAGDIGLVFAIALTPALVLLLAWINVATLLSTRASARQHELAVRIALGASTSRIVRLSVVDAFLVGIPGAVLGVASALVGARMLAASFQADVPHGVVELALQWPAGIASVVLAVVTTLVLGVRPARWSRRLDPGRLLAESTPNATPMSSARGGLRVALSVQLGATVALLSLAALALRSQDWYGGFALGVDETGLLKADMRRSAPAVEAGAATLSLDALAERLVDHEAIRTAAASGWMSIHDSRVEVELAEGRFVDARVSYATTTSSSYFEVLGVTPVAGRTFGALADSTSVAAIVNESMADHLWQGASPVGRRLRFVPSGGDTLMLTVAGVVPNFDFAPPNGRGANPAPRRTLFVRDAGRNAHELSLYFRPTADDSDARVAVYGIIRGVEPTARVDDVMTAMELAATFRQPVVQLGGILTLFAISSGLLALLGTYATIAAVLEQRRRELAIRLAIGATAGRALRSILREPLRAGALGLVGGTFAAWLTGPLFASALAGVSGRSWATLLTGVVAGLAIAMGSAGIAMRRALRMQIAWLLSGKV